MGGELSKNSLFKGSFTAGCRTGEQVEKGNFVCLTSNLSKYVHGIFEFPLVLYAVLRGGGCSTG